MSRKLSEIVPEIVTHPPVKSADVVDQPFILLGGSIVETKLGKRVVFTICFPDNEEEKFSLWLPCHNQKQKVIDALKEGPLGPVTLEERPSKYGHPYLRLVDYTE